MTVAGSGELAQQTGRGARQEFAHQFGSLYEAGGSPPLRLLATAARQRRQIIRGAAAPAPASAQRISDWKSGRNVPYRFESLVPVLVVLVERARRRGNTSGVEMSVRGWKQIWERARDSKSATTLATGPIR